MHLALLDLNLPRFGRLEVPATIRSSQACRPIPVVILTSPKSVNDITRSYQPGANCHLTKPFGVCDDSDLGQPCGRDLARACEAAEVRGRGTA
ncbi:response regulator [Bradyrhizobium sp.]|uniref:response regulator n=1 Tax=Bradyrhizobium sp. TaxID=376 RepID=UPI0039C86FE1